jgi:hypothetical protein
MNELTPPRIEEGYQAAPTKREDTFGDTISKMSSDAFADAWKKATEAGRINVNADDPRILTAFKQANKYVADMASAGMPTAEGIGGAIAGAIGEVFGGSPEGEVRLARDILAMTEAFAGSGVARGANLIDDLIESGAGVAGRVAARANQPGPMPEVLGSNLGNAVIRNDNTFRGEGAVTTSIKNPTKPFAVRVTGQSQIEDMIRSGLVRPPEGGYAGKPTVYFHEMDKNAPTSVFHTPKDDPNKGFSIVMDSNKAANQQGPISLDDILHVWTLRNGEMVDVLPEILQKNNQYEKGFAEGGMAQMEKLFEEGGMTDDGMTREPVTGNEVPPGSLAEEVRDDIPAKLSSGEYVVPADVVRFFGVKFFEDLRAQAKEGLSEMDKDGRIGGTPAVEDEELTPEEEQMLREALGAPMQMAEGGVVAEPFDRTQFTLGAQSGFQTRRYFNPTTKEERNISFINGMPMGKIPDGFVPYTEEAAKAAEVKPSEGAPAVTPAQEGGEGKDVADASKESGGGYADWAAENKEAIMSDPIGFGNKALEGASKTSGGGILGGLLGGVVGQGLGALGDLGKMDTISDIAAALSVAESKGLKGTPEYDKLAKDLETLTGTLNAPISKLGVNQGWFATGKQKTKALNDLISGGEGIGYTSSGGVGYLGFGGTPETGFTRSVATGSTAPSTSSRPSRNPAYGGSTAPSAPSGTPSAGPAGGASAGPSRGGDDRSAGGFGIDARAKGGLMMKPKKNKTKGKGLAAKG